MTRSAASQITGDDIISELIRNADAGRFKVRYTILVPCVFNVYLHPRDYELIQPIADLIREEAVRALKEHLSRLNKPRTARSFGKRFGSAGEPRPEYKILEKQWMIQFHGDQEERLRAGEIEIYSELGSARPKDFGAGAMTTFITRHHAGDPVTVAGNSEGAHDQVLARAVLARVRYRDSGIDKTFVMTSEEIVIGRGGKAVWVDLKLEGPADVSREHCRIRRDPDTGTFFIRDLSQFGTTVNGTPIPNSVERIEGGDKVDRNREVLLPSPAKITLADVCTLEFEAEP
jgi:FHA domain-containing protein